VRFTAMSFFLLAKSYAHWRRNVKVTANDEVGRFLRRGVI